MCRCIRVTADRSLAETLCVSQGDLSIKLESRRIDSYPRRLVLPASALYQRARRFKNNATFDARLNSNKFKLRFEDGLYSTLARPTLFLVYSSSMDSTLASTTYRADSFEPKVLDLSSLFWRVVKNDC